MKKRSNPAADVSEAMSLARNHNFNRLWGSQILSQVAQNLLNFALIIRVFQLAEGTRLANISVALLIVSFGIPSVLFAAAAGVYVDHWNKRLVLLITNFLRAFLVLGYLAFEHNLWMVLLLSFLISTVTQFFTPAESAAIPALVNQRQLLRANSLFVFTLYASFIAGYSASAPVIALFGSNGPYILTSVMFVLAGVLDWFLPNLHSTQSLTVPIKRLVRYTVREVLSNWRLIKSEHNLIFPILQLTVGQILLGVIMALAPALAAAILDLPIEHSSHYLIIPAGIGLIAGVLAVDSISRAFGKARIILGGIAAGAVALIAIGSLKSLSFASIDYQPLLLADRIGPIVAVLVFVLGFSNAIVSTTAQTILQESTSESSRGKVFGALAMMMNIAATLPVLFAGALADLAGVSSVVLWLGLLLLGFGTYQYLILRRKGYFNSIDR